MIKSWLQLHINNGFGAGLKGHRAVLGHRRLSRGAGGRAMEINGSRYRARRGCWWPCSHKPWVPGHCPQIPSL